MLDINLPKTPIYKEIKTKEPKIKKVKKIKPEKPIFKIEQGLFIVEFK